MQTNKITMIFLIALLPMLLYSGCTYPAYVTGRPASDSDDKYQPQYVPAKRFQEPVDRPRTAIDSAIELSEKYAELANQMAAMRQRNRSLTEENSLAKEQITSLKQKLRQTENELTQANELLVDMHIELNNWKTDVIGFRDEMRNAEETQLQALYKIYELLGGEVKPQSTQTDKTSSADEPSAQPQES